MQNKNLDYKVGDWVLLKESFIQKILEMNKETGNKILKKYSSPQQIIAISREEMEDRIILEFSPKRKWMLNENVFRLATEKELKELKIKSIFLNNK
jgi:hypothetical protein